MSAPPPSLLICDHRGEGLAQALLPLSGAGWRLSVSTELRRTLAELARLRPAAIVLDPLVEGGAAELEALEAARPEGPAAPVLLVADPHGPHGAVVATRERAPMRIDLVHRGAPPEEYLLRLERLLAAEEQRREIDLLRHAALHDDRTDLLRPKAFQQRLAEHFSAAQRHRQDLVLLLIDLDDFGLVNKAFDHTVGDLVIAKVGEVIRRTLRTEDVAGRLGGDEFAVLLPYTHKLDGARVVRRLCEEIGELSESLGPIARGLSIGASLGFETFDGTDLDSLETLRRHAELALREAKRQGGRRGVYFRSLRAGT